MPADGGLNYKNPHLEKCWLANGFDFNGYDTLYIAPTVNAAKDNAKDEEMPLQRPRRIWCGSTSTDRPRTVHQRGYLRNRCETGRKSFKAGEYDC